METQRRGGKGKVRREQTDADHGRRQAERLIKEMSESLGLREAELLAGRKGDWRKRAIAQRVRRETSVSLGWLGQRLGMGSEGYVSRMAASVNNLRLPPRPHSIKKTGKRK